MASAVPGFDTLVSQNTQTGPPRVSRTHNVLVYGAARLRRFGFDRKQNGLPLVWGDAATGTRPDAVGPFGETMRGQD